MTKSSTSSTKAETINSDELLRSHMRQLFPAANHANISKLTYDELLSFYIEQSIKMPQKENINPIEIDQIKQVVLYLVNKGAKVASKKNYVDQISFKVDVIGTSKMFFDARLTHLAIALIDNGSNLKLNANKLIDGYRKSPIVRAVLKHDPKSIDMLISKHFIAPDFVVTRGLTLYDYAIKDGATEATLKAIARQVENKSPDLIYRKKVKALETPLLQNPEDLQESGAQDLRKDIVTGINTENLGAINFAAISNSKGKVAKYMQKSDEAATHKFATTLFRVLSSENDATKGYAARGSYLAYDEEKDRFTHLTKWDSSIKGNYPLKDGLMSVRDSEFSKNYARLVGVLQVFGEGDWNELNYLQSDKTTKPVKIDNSLLINGAFSNKKHRIYGSLQSKEFLYKMAGQELLGVRLAHNAIDSISRARRDPTKTSEDSASVYIEEYNKGLDDNLLAKIKENIKKNPLAKEAFIEFMAGIKGAIDLSEDKEFLNQYAAKFKDELGDSVHDDILICCEIFQENVEQAKKQFKWYLEYFAEIAPERAAKTTQFIVPKVVKVKKEETKDLLVRKIAAPLFFKSIESDDVDAVKKALLSFKQQKIDFNSLRNTEVEGYKKMSPLSMAILDTKQAVLKVLVEELRHNSPSSGDFERALHSEIKQGTSPLRIAIEENKVEAVNYLLEQGCYDLDHYAFNDQDPTLHPNGYGGGDSKSSRILHDTAKLKKMLSSNSVVTMKSIQEFPDANLKSLVKKFNRTTLTKRISTVDEGKSLLQVYIENLIAKDRVDRHSLENIAAVLGYFKKNGLDIDAKIIKNNKPLSLLGQILDTNKEEPIINFSKARLAIALLKNGAKFDDLTNLQKSRLVRGVANLQNIEIDSIYLEDLLRLKVIDQTFILEKDGSFPKKPLAEYIKDKKSFSYPMSQKVLDLFDPAKSMIITAMPLLSREANSQKSQVDVRTSSADSHGSGDSGVGLDTDEHLIDIMFETGEINTKKGIDKLISLIFDKKNNEFVSDHVNYEEVAKLFADVVVGGGDLGVAKHFYDELYKKFPDFKDEAMHAFVAKLSLNGDVSISEKQVADTIEFLKNKGCGLTAEQNDALLKTRFETTYVKYLNKLLIVKDPASSPSKPVAKAIKTPAPSLGGGDDEGTWV